MDGAPGEPWWVYMVRCADGSLYCGVARDVDARVAQHNAARGAKYTRGRLPVTLVWRERQPTRGDALRRELAVKRLTRPAKLRLLAQA